MVHFKAEGQIPCIAETDVLVVGSTAAAVAAALSARQRGASVYLVSDRAYCGEELAAWFDPFPEAGELGPILAPLFAEAGSEPSPLAIKRILEQALIANGIPFLFNCRPAGLLAHGETRVAGVIFASRCVWFHIKARHVVDATLHGLVASLGPWKKEKREKIVARFNVLAPARGDGRKISIRDKDRETADIFEIKPFSTPVDCSRADVAELAGLEQQVRRKFYSFGQVRSGDSLQMVAPWRFETIPDSSGLTLAGTAALDELTPDLKLLFALAETSGKKAAEAAAASTPIAGAALLNAAGPEAKEELKFGPSPIRWGVLPEQIALKGAAFDLLDEVDVLVVGGGTGGAPAAIGAARSGAKTLLLESLPGLGGVGTMGLIGKYWFGNRIGFTAEMDQGIAAMGEGSVNNGCWNSECKMAWYLEEISKAGGTVWFGSSAFAVVTEGDRVTGALVTTPFGSGFVRTKTIIDATGNADIPAAAGAPCRSIGANHVAVQGTGLPPRRPGVGYRNTDYTFVDENDVVNVTQSFVTGREKFRDEFDLAQIVDSRERRQIVGDIELSPLDFLADRTFPDTFVVAKSNFDTHGFTTHPVFMTFPPDKKPLQARVPFRCLLPKGLEGVLVTGLGVSAHRDAIPVIRMQPDVQNQGYAAGIAAAMAAGEGKTFRELPMRELQKKLVACGILEPVALTEEDSFPLPGGRIREAVESGTLDYVRASVIFANPDASIPLLQAKLAAAGTAEAEKESAAVLLGMMGESCAAPLLMELVARAGWDKGWNYTGMGQFGMSLSRLDSMIVALGRAGDLRAVPVLAEKIRSLVSESEFSHCRALALAAGCLRSPALAEPLAGALRLPGMGGHAWTNLASVVSGVQPDPEETGPRNLSLRELALARGLRDCGDFQGLGEKILRAYAGDLRGHYANHALAVLRQAVDVSAPAPVGARLEMA